MLVLNRFSTDASNHGVFLVFLSLVPPRLIYQRYSDTSHVILTVSTSSTVSPQEHLTRVSLALPLLWTTLCPLKIHMLKP